MMSMLGCWCALSLAVTNVVAPLQLAVREAPASPASPAVEVDDAPPRQSTEDAIYAERVRVFTERFQQGMFQYHRGAYALAAAEFEQAFAAMAAEAALRNVAESYEKAGDDVAAALAARRYLTLPSCDTPEVSTALCGSHREELEATLARLMLRIGEVRLEVARGVTLRQIRINGRVTAREDFPVLVVAGRVDVDLQGAAVGERRQRVIEVRAGESQVISVDGFDTPIKVPGDPPVPGRQRGSDGKWLRPTFWVGLGVTSASAIALGTLGGLTLRTAREFEREQAKFNEQGTPCALEPDCFPDDVKAREQRLEKSTNIMVGVTAGLAMLTLVVGIVAATRPRNGGTTRASTRTQLRFNGSGAVLRY